MNLMREYEKIERKENRFLRNGRISNFEADELISDLKRLERMTRLEMHDRDSYESKRRY
jgi:hypothetical protein